MRHELITSPKPHHQALEIMAAKALAEEDFVAAFQLADRRCRIEPPPQAHSYVLRADASYKLGDQAAALADVTAALKASPRDLGSIRRLFTWGNETQRLSAASDLTDLERDVATLRAAIKLLAANGRRRLANLSVFDGYITGWAVWEIDEPAELTITSVDGAITSLLAPDPFHPLSSQSVRATSFHLARPASPQPQIASIAGSGDRFFSKRMPPNQRDRIARGNPSRARKSPDAMPTVIVPVYADFEATRACLESLVADRSAGKTYRVMIVNDASPDQEIRDCLKIFARHPHVEILTNPFNLGFVGSVNAALSRLSGGDVVLLNADTIVPPGFVDRMKAVARDGDDIGTIVPLSNNSEITDFPLPFHNNPLGSYAEIVRLDGLAAKANKAAVIEIPNGTGFCLYITRACLDATGGLSESFQRGYLEDIDFCLRARERGFRSVCAPSVYVGHAGSRSFQGEKRGLVLHNLDLLDQRFPHFRAESAAFVAADPVRPARQAIERLMPITQQRPVLILTGGGAIDAIAQARAQQLVSQGHAAILLALQDQGGQLCFRSVDHAAPQSLSFALSSKSGWRDLTDYLARLRPSHCEMIDLSQVCLQLVTVFDALDIPFDVWIVNGASLPAPPRQSGDERAIISTARKLLAPCMMAQSFASRQLPGRKVELRAIPIPTLSLPRHAAGPRSCMAIVPTRCSANEFLTIRELAMALQGRPSHIDILVAGSTIDDERLMSHPNVFVTGPVDLSELSRVLAPHDVRWMLTGFDQVVVWTSRDQRGEKFKPAGCVPRLVVRQRFPDGRTI